MRQYLAIISCAMYTESEGFQVSMPRIAASSGMPPLDDFLCFAIYGAGHALNRAYKPLLDPLGLTYPQYLVMVALWEKDDRTVGQLGETVSLESSTLTPLLKRLEAAGLISRRRDAADERQVRIGLTTAGRRLRGRAAGVPGCIQAATGLGDLELRRLRAAIGALRESLQRHSAPR
jgi:DNA-binding MarR family transcriptional regulator